MNTALPLVTLGLPVRNGAAMLKGALDSIVAQDYPNLEVIVSDNASTDETPAIAWDYAGRYPFIRLMIQKKPLRAFDNFMVVLGEARGEFFAWCAHDDTRSPDFVSGLLPALAHENTVLAFGDLFVWDHHHPPRLNAAYDFANVGLPRWRRLRKTAFMQCYHFYGLWRRHALVDIPYSYTHWWPDMPIMLAAACRGEFRYVKGPAFNYYEVRKTDDERALYQDYRAAQSNWTNLQSLLKASFLTISRSGLHMAAALATFFLVEKYVRQIPRYLGWRR